MMTTLSFRSLLTVLLILPGTLAGQEGDDELVPENTAVLEITLPTGATVQFGEADYGEKRKFTFRPLEPGRNYLYEMTVHFRGGQQVKRTLLMQGGRRVRMALASPDAVRPEIVLQTGHSESVRCTAISPDGRLVATGSYDKTAILWDVATGQQLCTFRGHGENVQGVTFTPNGKSLFTWSSGRAILWSVATGKRLRESQGALDYIHGASLSPDGRLAVLAGNRHSSPSRDKWAAAYARGGIEAVNRLRKTYGEACVWDLQTGQIVRTLFSEEGFDIDAVAFSPDGRQVIVSSRDEKAILWETATGRRVQTFQGYRQPPWSLTDSRRLSAVKYDILEKSIVVADGERVITFVVVKRQEIDTAVFRPYANELLTLTDDVATIWDVMSGVNLREINIGADCSWMFFSSNGRHLLAIANAEGERKDDDKVRNLIVYDADIGRELHRLRLTHGKLRRQVALSPDGHSVLIADTNELTLALWDLGSGRRIVEIPPRVVGGKRVGSVLLNGVAFSPTGRQFVVYEPSAAASISLRDAKNGARIRTLQESNRSNSISSPIAWSPDGACVVSGTHVYARQEHQSPPLASWNSWDLKTGRLLRTLPGGHILMARSVMFSPDSRLLLSVGADFDALLWDLDSGTLLHSYEMVKSASFNKDGSLVLTCSVDGLMRFYDVATGDEVLQMARLGGGTDWLAATPQGLFDGTPKARAEVAYRVGKGTNLVPVDRFFQDFYRPGLLEEVFGGRRPTADVKFGQTRPPLVKIVSPDSGIVASQQVTLEVEAVDQGGGVAGLAIFQNGARVLALGETRREDKTVYRTFKIALIEGKNFIRVTATSGDGSWEAQPASLVLSYEEPLEKSELYLVVVGVNQYSDANLNLNYAATDAKAMADLFRRRGDALYADVHVTELLDQEATRSKVKDTLKEVAAETRPQDTLLVFLAGHGTMVGQRYYFVPHELEKNADRLEDDIRKQGLPADEISDYLGSAKALKRILILDTCSSGGALSTVFKGRSGFALRGAIERLSRSQGVFTIAAASATEEAQESKQLGHGVLSYALLAGLKAVEGGPLGDRSIRPSSPDRVVDVMEWFTYAAGQVPRLTEKFYGVPQGVQTSTQGTSFPVLSVDD